MAPEVDADVERDLHNSLLQVQAGGAKEELIEKSRRFPPLYSRAILFEYAEHAPTNGQESTFCLQWDTWPSIPMLSANQYFKYYHENVGKNHGELHAQREVRRPPAKNKKSASFIFVADHFSFRKDDNYASSMPYVLYPP